MANNEEFVFLTSTSSIIECELFCQQLKGARIKYQLEDYDINAVNILYAGSPFMGRKIFVPYSKIKIAKEILGIKDELQNLKKTKRNYQNPFLYKIIASIILLMIFLNIIFGIIFMINYIINI